MSVAESSTELRPESSAAVHRLARASGDEFLGELVQFLRARLDLDFAFVCELHGERWELSRTLAVATRAGLVPNFVYELDGTPCSEIEHEPLVIARGVAARYPRDPFMQEHHLESYLGVPVCDAQGRPLGLFGCSDRRELADPEGALAFLREFSGRVAAELTYRRALGELRAILESSTATEVGVSFAQLAGGLARALHCRTGLVSELVEGEPRRFRIRGIAVGGELRTDLDGLELTLADTPCEQVFQHGHAFFPAGLLGRFPAMTATLDLLGRESYIGLAFSDRSGRRIGHVAALNDSPMREGMSPQALLSFFALRAGAELERERAETMRMDVERKHLAAQRIESLGILAGGIAHDFNNLLVGILGNASLAMEEARHDAPVQAHLAEIATAARRAAELANQLLAYSGKGRFEVSEVDLSALAQELANLLRASIAKHAELRLQLARPLPLVRGDATQIRQVLMNLVLNAAEALGEHAGVVSVRTAPFRADAAFLESCAQAEGVAPGDFVMLEVADTGSGMDQATQERIFDPFFTTKFTGRGLGLSAVLGIVRSHRGALWFRSEPASGSVFRVLLPPTHATLVPAAPAALAPGRGASGGLVLVVDDEPLVRRSTARMLAHLGYEVAEAADGQAALELQRTCGVRLKAVLLDMTMPHMRGEEVFAALRQRRADLPVVLMSGYDEHEATALFPRHGLAGFLRKPFTLAELSARLQAALFVAPAYQ